LSTGLHSIFRRGKERPVLMMTEQHLIYNLDQIGLRSGALGCY
jgi:hypothetical protein